MVVYAILISLSLFIGGFFLGAKVGHDRAEETFTTLLTSMEGEEHEETMQYSHTDFMSYYYDAYQPFKEFRRDYLAFFDQFESVPTDQQMELITQLKGRTQQIKATLQGAPYPQSSPLLKESMLQYIEALSAFEKGLKEAENKTDLTTDQIKLLDDPQFQAGQAAWLRGQTLFYEALVLWESIYETNEAPDFVEAPLDIRIDHWVAYGFHRKNEVIAKALEEKEILTYFNPEDAQIYLASYANQQGENAPINTVADALDVLIASNSIQEGAFLEQTTPQEQEDLPSPIIPLFNP